MSTSKLTHPLTKTFIAGIISGAVLDYTLIKSSYYTILLEEQAKDRLKAHNEFVQSIQRIQTKYPAIFDDLKE